MLRAGGALSGRMHLGRFVAIEVKAFGDARGMGALRRAGFALVMVMAAALYERRSSRDEDAACLLGCSWRAVLPVAGLIAGIWLLGTQSRQAAQTVLVCMLVVAAVMALVGARRLPALVRLHQQAPPVRCLYVHCLASRRPGAGAGLLQDLARESDRSGVPLLLDAGNARLKQYYRQFGFVATGTPVAFRRGQERTRMWRPLGGLAAGATLASMPHGPEE